jgi:site-specific recombinase XerC
MHAYRLGYKSARAGEEVSESLQGINALRDRAMFLLMLRCGLRVGEVSSLPWLAIDLSQCTRDLDHQL